MGQIPKSPKICLSCEQGHHKGCHKIFLNRSMKRVPCQCPVCQKSAKIKRVWHNKFPSAQPKGFPVDHVKWRGPRNLNSESARQAASLNQVWELAMLVNSQRLK